MVCGRIRRRQPGELADDPGGEFFGKREGAASFLSRWLEDVTGIAELGGKWREFQRVVQEPRETRRGGDAEADEDFQRMGFNEGHFSGRKPAFDGFFGGLLAMVLPVSK